MFSSYVNRTRYLWTYENASRMFVNVPIFRHYADDKKCKKCKKDVTACMRANVDIPREAECLPCKRRQTKKIGIMHKIKLCISEGGTNFGTPIHWLDCALRRKSEQKAEEIEPEPEVKEVKKEKKEPVCPATPTSEVPPALPEPPDTPCGMPHARPGVQVTLLGADTTVGNYVAMLLKQCPQIKKLRLYEANASDGCSRNLCNVVQDLQYIDTNCLVQAYGCHDYGLNLSLQATDIVLILENAYLSPDMSFRKRFEFQAPLVKRYADAIARECPKAFIIVCATPIDCMVPLVAETLKETAWYDPNKLLGSMAVAEMRASTLAARALCLEPHNTRVPCVGGTEGDTLVPLFSQAVDYFEFTRRSSELMTETVRNAPLVTARCEGPCMRAAELSEAYAIGGLVSNVANALLCQDVPRISGFVETDPKQVITPTRYLANAIELSASGIVKHLVLPKMSELEASLLNVAMLELEQRTILSQSWHAEYISSPTRLDIFKNSFFKPKTESKRFDDCAYGNVY